MITHEENEILTRVGPGTPMGELMRRYWIPAFLSEELPGPDCPPVQTRLLGEDLVGFRDSQGRVGLLGAYCAHRQAPLFYGRNEESGLRCVYHGWKYDVNGNVIETPGEPPGNQPCVGMRHTAYPCIEANRLIYTYMGPPEKKPLLPAVHWLTLPSEQVCVGCKFFLECSWLQSLEGDIDRIHTHYLHTRGLNNQDMYINEGPSLPTGTGADLHGGKSAWRIARHNTKVETDILPYGVQGAHFFPTDNRDYMHVIADTFYMPCNAMLAGGRHIIYQVPADDYTCYRYDLLLSLDGPISDAYVSNYRSESWPTIGHPGWQKKMNRENHYLIDRDKQKTFEIYSGIDARNHTQDAMITENMGPRTRWGNIVDRTKNHYTVTDGLIIAAHRMLLNAARDVQEGLNPPGVAFKPEDNKYPRNLGGSFDMRTGDNWRQFIKEFNPVSGKVMAA
jgi:phthalate 4,5-dioxygenase